MPSTLRFRSPYPGEKEAMAVPPTPKSPRGVYTGNPVPPLSAASKSRLPIRILFGVLTLAALLSVALFNCRRHLIPDIPKRSSVYWKAKSAFYAASTTAKQTKGFGPPREEVPAVFVDQDAFQAQGTRGDRAWLRMLPKGDGRVVVKDPRRWGLPRSASAVDSDGVAVADTEVFEVTVVRQLECMTFLRQTFIDYNHEMHPSTQDRAHVLHCLDHVRQALLCAADTTLEPTSNGVISTSTQPQHYEGRQAAVDQPKSDFQSALHTCKNWTAVKEWIEENQVH